MLNPYTIYQNLSSSTSNHLQFEPDRDSASPSPTSETSNRSDNRNKRSSWSLTKERCLITAYKDYYDTLKSTKSSQGKKNIWEDILRQFQSMCLGNGGESEKSLEQIKEKWRALLDKYKNVCDHNNQTGREWKTFTHHEDIDKGDTVYRFAMYRTRACRTAAAAGVGGGGTVIIIIVAVIITTIIFVDFISS